MKNVDVIVSFLNCRRANTANLSTDGVTLKNYDTVIACWSKGNLFVNLSKYSTTTSKIQTYLKREIADYGLAFIEVKGLGYGDKLLEIARNHE